MLIAIVIAGPSLIVILSASEESLAQGKLLLAIMEMASGHMFIAMIKALRV